MNYSKLVISLSISFLAAYVGSTVTLSSLAPWYNSLIKPEFTPPNWVFGPIWTMLYISMGVALYLIWVEKKHKKKVVALSLFSAQLALNLLWSISFFAFQSPLLGLIIIIFLWLILAFTIISFRPLSKMASLLLIPYQIWVSFALLLNGAIVVLN